MIYFLLLVGIFLLYIGADYLIKGAIYLGLKMKISPAFLGIFVIGCGTSFPELLVSLKALANNHLAIAYGNIIGSNIFNVLIIMGLIVSFSAVVVKKTTNTDVIFLILSNVLFLIFFFTTGINLFTGTILLVCFAGSLIFSFKSNKDGYQEEIQSNQILPNIFMIMWLIILGFIALFYGSSLLIDSSIAIARTFGMSEKIIGLTIVAAGTSLPELASSVVAMMKKESDIAIFNILGSNIFNVTAIAGIMGVLKSDNLGSQFLLDGIFFAIALILLSGVLLRYKNIPIAKHWGVLCLFLYGAYNFFMFT